MSTNEVLSRKGDENHVSYVCSTPNAKERCLLFKTNWYEMKKFYDIVVCNNPLAFDVLKKCGFHSLFTLDLSNADCKLTEALMERWWKKTKIFHFPEFELGITPLDFVRLTGIPIRGGLTLPIIPRCLKKSDFLGYDTTYLACVKANRDARAIASEQDIRQVGKGERVGTWKSLESCIPISFLHHYILSREDKPNSDVYEDLTRIFLLWCIGKFLVGNTTTRVHKGWLALLTDLDNVGNYDWGSAALGNLYDCLDRWTSGDRTEMGGMWNIIEYWYYFYFRNCQPLLNKKDGFILNQCLYPAISLFNKSNLRGRQYDSFKHSLTSARQQIDMRSSGSVIWQPWKDDVYADSPEVMVAENLSKKRLVFYGCIKGERLSAYLGERFLRQTTGEVVIPFDPPPPPL